MKDRPAGILRIVFVAAESLPWIKTGGLGDVMGALPRALHDLGDEVVAILPLYKQIDRETENLKLLATLDVPFQENVFKTNIYEAPFPGSECRALFIENQYYFERNGIYYDPDSGENYSDEADRWFFFQLAVIELISQLELNPDILICADWQAAIIPALLRIHHKDNPQLSSIRTVLSLHNLGYQGMFSADSITALGLPKELMFPLSPFEYYGQLNCLKAGISFADHVITVSPTYADEIRTEEFGHGLDGVLRQHDDRVSGIINGIDTSTWNPARDHWISSKFSLSKLDKKSANRQDLLKTFELPGDFEGPVIGMVTRLTSQKGFNIIAGCLDRMLNRDLKFLILGTGEKQFEAFLTDVAKNNSDKFAVKIGYSEQLAHQIFAGSDMFLMPSQYEPCGLSQMYSMIYGTIPIVHRTGGLRDTVTPFLLDPDRATGFAFEEYNAEVLLETVDQAISAWNKPRSWRRIQRNGMKQDFSWKHSAKEYQKLFRKIVASPHWGE
jgi:starch synthase